MSMNEVSHKSSLDAELERHIDHSLLENINSSTTVSPIPSRPRPGAVLLSPHAKVQMTPSSLLSPETNPMAPPSIISPINATFGLLSPPGARYAFEPENAPVSPLLSSTNNRLIGNFNNTSIQRPLSAQSFHFNTNNETFDAFRPFSAQGIPTNMKAPERPLSAIEIDSITFENDLGNFSVWVTTLTSHQQKVVVDKLLDNLPQEVINYTRDKVQYYTASNFPFHHHHQKNEEPITLDSVLDKSLIQPIPLEAPAAIHIQRALSPSLPSFDRSSLLQDIGNNRARSADPYSKFNHKSIFDDGSTPSKSTRKTFEEEIIQFSNNNNNSNSKQFDITNLAQQMTQTPIKVDYNNANALKLSALSTINSRAQLDSGKKRGHLDDRPRNPNNGAGGFHTINTSHVYNLNEELNQKNSSSVPHNQRINFYDQITTSPSVNRVINKQRNLSRNNGNGGQVSTFNTPDPDHLARLASLNSAVKNLNLNNNDIEYHTPYKQHQNHGSNSPVQKSPAINPKHISNPKLLNDIPAWLKSLRLHKYTPCLKDIPWKELIYLDDRQLEAKGVTAMGARGKLLKAFDVVKQHFENGLIKE